MKSNNETGTSVTLWGATEIAAYLNRSARQIYDAFERKTLPIGKVGGVYIARTDELDAFLTRVCRNNEVIQ
jgi:hypothetical protein